jgi:hypothetical protein
MERHVLYGATDFQYKTTIHSKSGISWMEKSADDLEFSAEGLSGNAKTFKFALL